MVVILTDNSLLPTCQVCQSCMLADHNGQPRWRGGQLDCGRVVSSRGDRSGRYYKCVMGFHVARIDMD
ncbi:MAG: hypothetical protein EA395_14330 [Phormidium sp. GEM2.Bin31]|nr:hypothetical protein [Phormidium sp. BM_Day4_Bin.17]TVR06410.1 MAG: hypothetical protein EA395_14330 [Phormidium sp. GEM2.Bin31]UCJ12244.1 MAG: hypothetical protein JWS08_21565 [Phormidium sp. PBR-2020]